MPSSTPTSATRPTQTTKQAAWSLILQRGRFSFRLTAPYSEERRKTASEAAKKCGIHRKITHFYGDSN